MRDIQVERVYRERNEGKAMKGGRQSKGVQEEKRKGQRKGERDRGKE